MDSLQEDRVRKNTASNVNEKMDQVLLENMRKAITNKGLIDTRIAQINKEWDIERWLETNASIIAFVGILLAYFFNIYWLILPAVVLVFLFEHAVQGWCPPLPIFRRFNVRTQKEIDQELYSLKLIRGDFNNITVDNPNDILSAIRK